MKRLTKIFTASLLTLLLSSPLLHAQEFAPISRITIEKYQPARSDARALRLHDKSTAQMTDAQIAEARVAYVVKIYATMPAETSRQPQLLIDGQPVSQFGNFCRGVFVKVFTKAQLVAWAGKRVVISIPTLLPHPDAAPDAVYFPSYAEPAAAQAGAAVHAARPSKLAKVLEQ